MPQTDKQSTEKQNNGDRHKPVIILSVVAVVLVGIFLIILFFFHGNLHSRSSFPSGAIITSKGLSAPPALKLV